MCHVASWGRKSFLELLTSCHHLTPHISQEADERTNQSKEGQQQVEWARKQEGKHVDE